MTKNFAVVVKEKVINIVVSDKAFEPNWFASDVAQIGWAYKNGEFTPPATLAPTKEEQEVKRKSAYTAEADPLFFKWQAGEATELEWKAKRQDIRNRLPYPDEI